MDNSCSVQSGSSFMQNFKIPKKEFNVEETEKSLLQNSLINNLYENSNQLPLQSNCSPLVVLPAEARAGGVIQQSPLFYRAKEVPKTGSAAKYKDTYPHIGDPTLPKELTEQFQPLYCKLCSAKLTSNVMAKLHYKSKNHEKKVRKFLIEYAERMGEPLHDRARVCSGKKQKLEEDKNPKYYFCETCNLPLTGRLHAESHYMGKNHHKVLEGRMMPPAKRLCKDEFKVLLSEGDNIGLDFRLPTESYTGVLLVKEVHAGELHCDVCGVNVTSEQQMTMHVNGQRHKKKLQQQVKNSSDMPGPPENSILSTLSSNVPSGDLSVYRTPSGYYYCKPCNLSLNSEIQFNQHLGSKKHRKKACQSKE